MEIFPAIDIRKGKVVRLTEGDFSQMRVYGDSPAEAAARFLEQGARNLHVVDLDGARDGRSGNFEAVRDACRNRGLFVEVGGGIRDRAAIEKYAEIGVGRVILGTVAVDNFHFVEEAVKEYGGLVAVGVDARDGRVAVRGWRDVTDIDSFEFCRKLSDAGVATVIYTDIAKDGRLSGANMEAYRKLGALSAPGGVDGPGGVGGIVGFGRLDIVASGGVSFESEIATLRDIGIYAAILGKALYEGKLSLPRAVAIADGISI